MGVGRAVPLTVMYVRMTCFGAFYAKRFRIWGGLGQNGDWGDLSPVGLQSEASQFDVE